MRDSRCEREGSYRLRVIGYRLGGNQRFEQEITEVTEGCRKCEIRNAKWKMRDWSGAQRGYRLRVVGYRLGWKPGVERREGERAKG